MRLDPAVIKQQIDVLKQSHPDIWDDENFLVDVLEGQTDLVEFLRALERRRQEAVAAGEALAMTIDAWRARRARFDRRDEAIRELMLKMLQAAHLKKLEMPEASVWVRPGVPHTVIVDENQIPPEYFRIRKEVDKQKIKTALASFTPVAGCTLSNAEDVLSVRVK